MGVHTHSSITHQTGGAYLVLMRLEAARSSIRAPAHPRQQVVGSHASMRP